MTAKGAIWFPSVHISHSSNAPLHWWAQEAAGWNSHGDRKCFQCSICPFSTDKLFSPQEAGWFNTRINLTFCWLISVIVFLVSRLCPLYGFVVHHCLYAVHSQIPSSCLKRLGLLGVLWKLVLPISGAACTQIPKWACTHFPLLWIWP